MSDPEQRLTRCGHIRNQEWAPSIFFSFPPATIHDNCIILAATHPTVQTGDPCKDGWFLANFYAFNYMLKGLGSEQVWLTAADPHKLIAKYGHFLHGNPYEARKEVLSHTLLVNKELTPVTVIKSANMISRFLQQAKTLSERAKRNNAPLVLLIFCHGLPNYQLLLDNGNKNKGLSVTSLKGVLEPGARVTLITTACYSGGWVTNPDFNYTTMAAASEKSNSTGQSNAWVDSQSIGRACGSVFASTLFQTLAGPESPFLDDADLQSLPVTSDSELQPEDPSEEQVRTYNAFCHSVWQTCESRVHRMWDWQHFTFSAQDDRWNDSWIGRTGIPMAYFKQRWDGLPSFPYTGLSEIRALRNPAPENNNFTLPSSGQHTAGMNDIVEQMTENICHNRIKEMARLFRQTCPGDWTFAFNVGLGGLLRGFYEFNKYQDEAPVIVATIRFRWELGLLTDYIISRFHLPIPNGEMCILWDRYGWLIKIKEKADFQKRWDKIFTALHDGGFQFSPLDDQGWPFERPSSYLTAAIFEWDRAEEETNNLILEILKFVEKAKEFNRQRVCSNESVRHHAKAWIQSLHMRIHRSVSP